jgi:hypothetical protein
MSGNGCSCAGPSPAPAAPAAASPATPCGPSAQITRVVWDPLCLEGSTQQTSPPFALQGANAIDLVGITIGTAGTIQTDVQAQVSSNGENWTNVGSALQMTAIGYSASSLITGIAFRWVRFVASNAVGDQVIFSFVFRAICG